jgi:hypothetical protein
VAHIVSTPFFIHMLSQETRLYVKGQKEMDEPWFQAYVLLAFRIDKVLRMIAADSLLVDYCYGPPAWKTRVEAEPPTPAPVLLQNAEELGEMLACLDLEPQRVTFLSKQVLAMRTICQKLCGETFSLADELRLCFDLSLPLTKTPETQFEQAWAQAEETLPGTGDVLEREAVLEQRLALPLERAEQVVSFAYQALAETRRRTQTFVDVPPGEAVIVEIVRGQKWRANNRYLGDFRSRIDINLDIFTSFRDLLPFACHEGYPGHHSELALKEQRLFRERGYLEQAVGLLISPQAVISEGLATLAPALLFTPEEQQHWLAEQILPLAGVRLAPEEALWESPIAAIWMSVRRNAILLLHEGRTEHEVKDYLKQYLRISTRQAEQALAYFQRPFHESYTFTYTAGATLMNPWLQGTDRFSVFARFLTEQFTPSALSEQESAWER